MFIILYYVWIYGLCMDKLGGGFKEGKGRRRFSFFPY